MDDVIKLGKAVCGDGRFNRQELIEWWDQARLERSRVLVIGAGALGNEILKNLALVGIGSVFIADFDRIENSNLARSVLFREDDIGKPKAEVAAARVRAMHPGTRARAFDGNVVHDLGLGVFRWADVVICGLDNREARVAVNRACQKVGRAWIDGAIERLDGLVRMFLPGSGACYECTMNETDWQMLEARRSCALLSREEMLEGHTPTTATISSIVAGFQCQEMLKYLHGREVRGGAGLTINGQSGEVYSVSYPRKEDCLAHETLGEMIELPGRSSDITLGGLLARAREDIGPDATIELSREVIRQLECPKCGEAETVFVSLGKVSEEQGRCPACGEMRFPQLLHSVGGQDDFLDLTPAEIGLPPFDILVGRSGRRAVGYLMAGDERTALGELAAEMSEE